MIDQFVYFGLMLGATVVSGHLYIMAWRVYQNRLASLSFAVSAWAVMVVLLSHAMATR